MSEQQDTEPAPGLALLELYDTAMPKVYGYLLSRSGDRSLAEDLTAETFLAAAGLVRREPVPSQQPRWPGYAMPEARPMTHSGARMA